MMAEGQEDGEIAPEELVESDSVVAPPPPRSRRRDPLLGEVLDGRYEVLRLIARGGMGRIYSAEQNALGRKVALKVMDLGYSEDLDPDFQKRFFLEASTCAQLSHPNTIRVFDYGADGDICYIAMELVEGRTLLHAIHDAAPFPPDRVLHIARQICGSLTEAHRKGIIHRDLKPSNVLLTQHGDETDFVKVLDFGLVKLLREDAQEITRSGLFLGSPNYMSPEQIRATSIDQRSDLYSLGVILFMAMTGRAPFKRNSSINVLLAQLEEPAPMIAEVNPETQASPALQWTVMTCLEKDANARFGSVDELNKALKACQRELRGEYDAPLLLRLEAGSVTIETVPPGVDPMRAHGLRTPVSTQEATVESQSPTGGTSLPRPTFGYTPSILPKGSGVGWEEAASDVPYPSGPSLASKLPSSSTASRSGARSSPPPEPQSAPTPKNKKALVDVDTVEHPSVIRRTDAPGGLDRKGRRRKPAPAPTLMERYGVIGLSVVAGLLAIAALLLLVVPDMSPKSTAPVPEPDAPQVDVAPVVEDLPPANGPTATPDLPPTPPQPASAPVRRPPLTSRPVPRASTPRPPTSPATVTPSEPTLKPTSAETATPEPAAPKPSPEEPTPKKEMRVDDVRDPWAN